MKEGTRVLEVIYTLGCREKEDGRVVEGEQHLLDLQEHIRAGYDRWPQKVVAKKELTPNLPFLSIPISSNNPPPPTVVLLAG